jgi:hypothetical protein
MAGYLTWGALGLVGAGAFWMALGFGWGSGPRIGSAPLPVLLSGLLVVVALWGLVETLLGRARDRGAAPEWRPLVAVAAAVALFAATVEHIGLVPATLGCMFAAYLGQTEPGHGAFMVYAAGFAAVVWLIFSKGLGLPVPAFGG